MSFYDLTDENSQYPIEPVDEYTVEPIDEYSVEPVDEYTIEPVDEYTVEPVDEYTVEPVDEYTVEPVDEYTVEPVDEYTVEPVDEYSVEVIVKYSGNLNQIEKNLNLTVEILNQNYAIITTSKDKISILYNQPEIQYIEEPKIIYSKMSTNIDSSCIENVQQNEYLAVSGSGVIVCIIDSGIDYTHKDFRTKEGVTRIDAIWDQSIDGNPPLGFKKGTLYTQEEINKALKNSIPFQELPHQDFVGHGTGVAGVALGNGNSSNGKNKGVATNAIPLIVKLDSRKDKNGFKNTDLMRGIKFAYEYAKNKNKPLVINISFGTNDGAHDGKSLFETYINEMSQEWRSCIVVASGNEGSAGHHYQNKISTSGKALIEFTTTKTLKKFSITLWKSFVDIFNFEIIGPNSRSIGKINYMDGKRKFFYNNNVIEVIITEPNHYNSDQEIYFNFENTVEFIDEGVWAISVEGYKVTDGRIDAWLPVSEAVTSKTAFLNHSVETTLSIPSTAINVITVGGYNSENDSLAEFSGRGNVRNSCIVKPDLVAPAVNITVPSVGGGYTTVSGTSFAAPEVTGAIALLLEWGIVKKNSPYLYGQKIKAYLQLGARKNNNVEYPNTYWGYGKLCLKNTFDELLKYKNNNYFISSTDDTTIVENNTSISTTKSDGINPENQQTSINKSNTINDTPSAIPPAVPLLQEPPAEETNFHESILSEKYYQYLVKYNEYLNRLFKEKKYILTYTILDSYYAVVYIDKTYFDEFKEDFKTYIQYDQPIQLGLLGKQSLDVSGITQIQKTNYLNLTGRGVLLGFIDTGIDYTSPAFIYEDGTSKIAGIWDQTIKGTPPKNYKFGTEFSNSDINKALASEDPKSIVNHVDVVGHGTFLASVAGSCTNDEYIGACPDAKILAVKLKNAKGTSPLPMPTNADEYNIFDSSDLVLGIDYLIKKSRELNMPISICISVGSNFGGSAGLSLLEEYISNIAREIGVSVSIAAGNENGYNHHIGGKFLNESERKNFQLNVADGEKVVSLEVWGMWTDRYTLSIKSPLGEVVKSSLSKIDVEDKTTLKFEKSILSVTTTYPVSQMGRQLITVYIENPVSGIWNLTLTPVKLLIGSYEIYLPMRNFLKDDTKFLESNPEKTLTVPSTSQFVVSCCAYDENKNNLYVHSSRGPQIRIDYFPTLTAPGVDVKGLFPSGPGKLTGTSVAAAVTTGAAALLLQWGMIDKNETNMSTLSVRAYLGNGCERDPGQPFYTTEWGFGRLNLYNSFTRMLSDKQQ